jgi:UDP-N-acetylmuramoylalanine--D-glutamate ligase
MLLKALDKANILVLGLGSSGVSAVELALCHRASVTALDENASDSLTQTAGRLSNRGADIRLDWTADQWSSPVDLAIISPGISPESTLGRLAESLSCPVISEVEFAYHFCACPIIAVTGTNGKTTTVELLVHLLRSAGKRVIGAGNIGLPLSAAATRSAHLDFIVAELSSFQLERIDAFTPLAAALLNISDDHLDRHHSAEAYLDAKLNLFRNMRNPQRVVMHADLLEQAAVVNRPLFAGGQQQLVGARREDAPYRVAADGVLWCGEAGSLGISGADLKLRGDHNIDNVLAALGLCSAVGVSPHSVVGAVRSFAPNAHRQELVAVHKGVRFVNDSKATNPAAMIEALRTFGGSMVGKILLIAGGQNKRLDFEPVIPYLQQYVREIYLLGEAKEHLAQLWSSHICCQSLPSLSAVVGMALENAVSGDTVLLSPGCASQDMFRDYADRGNSFSYEVKRRVEA